MPKKRSTLANETKSRKQSQQPHGPIKPLSELADEYDAEHSGRGSST